MIALKYPGSILQNVHHVHHYSNYTCIIIRGVMECQMWVGLDPYINWMTGEIDFSEVSCHKNICTYCGGLLFL